MSYGQVCVGMITSVCTYRGKDILWEETYTPSLDVDVAKHVLQRRNVELLLGDVVRADQVADCM
jgi:hypothetical protein